MCLFCWLVTQDVNAAWNKRQNRRPSYGYDAGKHQSSHWVNAQSFHSSFPPTLTGLPFVPDLGLNEENPGFSARAVPVKWGDRTADNDAQYNKCGKDSACAHTSGQVEKQPEIY